MNLIWSRNGEYGFKHIRSRPEGGRHCQIMIRILKGIRNTWAKLVGFCYFVNYNVVLWILMFYCCFSTNISPHSSLSHQLKCVGPGLADGGQEMPESREQSMLLMGSQVHWHRDVRGESCPQHLIQANVLPFGSNNYYSRVEKVEPTSSLLRLRS